tara:strand:+ start:3040 stop:4077 length:1038 start_codon:yes stop_codon:yes gene_type:complete
MGKPLETFLDPVVNVTWRELGAIQRAAKLDGKWHVLIELGYPVEGLKEAYAQELERWIEDDIVLELKFKAPASHALPGASNVIAVASGKGGVGKSTTAVNLAVALDRAGAKAGILDADIYGPSQGIMLGIREGQHPEIRNENQFVPIRCHGIEAISMSMLVTDKTPMVWRGPMASGALQQLLQQTAWSDLDYLIVDMPPGTGDIQLTLSQQVSVGGAVIVTTPQEIALADARKGIEMFRKVSVPIIGIVENLSYFECDGCSRKHALFGEGGGERVAGEYGTSLLGEFPLDPTIREQTDAGLPIVAIDHTSPISTLYMDCARRTAAALWLISRDKSPTPTLAMDDQ